MVCQTVKVGTECIFMKKTGCSYNVGTCYPIVESCKGCDRVVTFEAGSYCKTYCEPSIKWAKGPCNFATHVKKEVKEDTFKLNPLKASKRNMSLQARQNQPLVSVELKTLLSSDNEATGEGFFCFFKVTQQKKLMIVQTTKIRI